jgi:poly-beta-1,6-N-acetyl-D-glucosamine synthase
MTTAPRYVVVSPVKDEARYVEHTLRSMTRQTLKPVSWVIVDDGSTDETREIVNRYAEQYSFIHVVQHRGSGVRAPGSAVIRAFNCGCESLGTTDYDVIVKLDCDLGFGPDYFEKLIGRLMCEERLGIASGVYLEQDSTRTWRPVKMPSYHAFGACKAVRRSCFEQIGRFVSAKGWDTVDEIRAMNLGWRTTHFVDLETTHHKPEGSGIGLLRTSKMHGEIFYTTGGDAFSLMFKGVRRLSTAPVVLGALALVFGYSAAALKRAPRLVTADEARAYRKLLHERLWAAVRKPLTLRLLQAGR